ncbi:MAG: apolipoprotein N-acyltransferase, partial [Bacteroidota bacterium]|nr:apolipoprotein N-acyltransferase [Bacteroidota bacterium]
MKRSRMLLLALLSALLLSIPFFTWGTGLLLMAAFVPLLFIEEEIASRKSKRAKKDRKGSVIAYAFITFGVFVLLTTWWIYHATWMGPIASVIVNGGYMILTFMVFHRVKRRLGKRLGYASFVIFWLAFEYLYIRAQINFPWIVLGNGFANDVMMIQWYEWTGALGGSLWVLVMNILIFKLVKGCIGKRSLSANRLRFGWVLGVLIVPLLFSLVRFMSYEELEDPYEMVVLQPNIDPFEKFGAVSQAEQTEFLLELADSLVTTGTDYIIGPETFINNGIWVGTIDQHPEVLKLKGFLKEYPEAKLVIGASTWKLYEEPSEFTSTSRPFRGGPRRYDYFNTAFQLDASGEIPLYHKSMLVNGVEKMPHKELLSFLEDLVVELGGTMRGNGTQEFRETFASPQDGTRVGPVICWESVFGEYVTEYVSEAGAHFLFIITNDGWWKDTPGHKQHNSFARLRAIETRRSV